jgi:lysozyme family protein
MADFKVAYDKLSIYEGGYSNYVSDTGGETYRGVARNYHPNWGGWAIVDANRSNPDFPKCLDDIPELQNLILAFYRIEFWDKIKGDDIINQSIADELFEQAVNLGIKKAVEFVQMSINILKKSGSDLLEDGRMGPITLLRINDFCIYDKPILLLKVLNLAQGDYYLKLTKVNDRYKAFIRGWLLRCRTE